MSNSRTVKWMAGYVEQRRSSIQEATKNQVMTDKLIQAARLAFFENSALRSCEPSTVLKALVEAGRLGLVPNSLGHCYLVPHGKRATLMIGARGYIWLAHQSDIWPIEAGVVCEGDEFEVVKGTEKRLIHRPAFTGGEPVAFYAVATLRRGDQADKAFEVMTLDEVTHIRDRYSKGSKAWAESFTEMAKKTVIRRLIKNLPMGSRLQDAFEVDGVAHEPEAIQAQEVEQPKALAADVYAELAEQHGGEVAS